MSGNNKDLKGVLEKVAELRKQDPGFQKALQDFVDAEAVHGHNDPVEGTVVPASRPSTSQP